MEYMYLYLYYLITVVFQIDCTNYIPTSSIICCGSTFSLTLDSYPLNFNFCLSSGCTVAFHYDLIWMSLIINEAEHLSIWLLIIWISFYFWDVDSILFLSSPTSPTGFICFFFFLTDFKGYLCTLNLSVLLALWISNIFHHSVTCLFFPFSFLNFLWPHPYLMEVPRLGIEPEPLWLDS